MRKRLFIALILLLMLVPMSIASAKDKPLKFETTYSFALGTAPNDDEGRSLIWSGTVSGAFEGDMEWWMHFGGGVDTGKVNHWDDAIWIIYPYDVDGNRDEGVYITGEEWGSTTWIPGGERANWRANGRVIAPSPGYEYLIGRPIHDGGKVDLGNDFPWSASGSGEFRIH